MSLTTIFREALDAIKDEYPEITVAVIIKGKTGTGTQDVRTDAAALANEGETGESSSRVRVNADVFDKPGRGDTITIRGKDCFALDVQTDGVGAFFIIEYSEQKPI